MFYMALHMFNIMLKSMKYIGRKYCLYALFPHNPLNKYSNIYFDFQFLLHTSWLVYSSGENIVFISLLFV